MLFIIPTTFLRVIGISFGFSFNTSLLIGSLLAFKTKNAAGARLIN